MRLDRMLGAVEVLDVRGDTAATEIGAVTYDSRRSVPGSVFCCLRGANADGHDHAGEAVASGAAALLCERPLDLDVTQVVVADARRSTAAISAAFFDHPSRRLCVVGITGTNGKTTTSHFLQGVLGADGRATEVIGTLSGERTTPEAPDLQAELAGFRDAGVGAVAMEVSSHSLAHHRVDSTWFEAAVFTNLSAEHLDFHGSMEEYFAVKAQLFDPARAAMAVVNADDRWGSRLLDAPLPVHPYSIADVSDLEVGLAGASFTWERHRVRLALGGLANVYNGLAAAVTARALGVAPGVIVEGLASVRRVPGRFERIDEGQPFGLVVDYAHTPAGLEQVLTATRPSPPGRLIAVFGCGGERDRRKRPAMGEVATRLADIAVVTSDNPRGEDPRAIIEEVRAGASRPERLVVEVDRRSAIALALGTARDGDVVVIAGKGHEKVQILGSRRVPFDDREVARDLLRATAGQKQA